jgi:hypothetical protein
MAKDHVARERCEVVAPRVAPSRVLRVPGQALELDAEPEGVVPDVAVPAGSSDANLGVDRSPWKSVRTLDVTVIVPLER